MGALGARAPRVKSKKRKRREERRGKRRGKEGGEREIMLVGLSYYNLNNEDFAICSEGNNVK